MKQVSGSPNDHLTVHMTYFTLENPLPPEPLCFSIITESRTVDFAAETLEEAKTWKRCLNDLIKISKSSSISDKIQPKYSSSQSLPIEKTKLTSSTTVRSADPPRRIPKNTETQSNWNETRDLLFQALRNNDYETVEYFLSIKNISVNQMDSNYQTPLMIACEQNSGHMTRLCLEYGARIDEFPEPFPTALHSAARSRSFECMSILIQTTHHRNNKLETLINRRDSDGNTALHISAYFGDANIIELLLCNGADMTIEDSYGRNALHLSSQYGSRRSLMVLLDQGGDSYLDHTDYKGYTPLHYCAEGGYLDCVELLLGAAADPLLQSTEGLTPYALAAQHNHPAICQVLRQYSDQHDPNSDDESLPQSDMNTFVSSLTKEEETIPRRENDDEGEEVDGYIISASRALELAMANTLPDDAEVLQREYQLYLLNSGIFQTTSEMTSENPSQIYEEDQPKPEEIDHHEDLTIPIEEFQLHDNWWQVYRTEDGYSYYYNSTMNLSQWDDPREFNFQTPRSENFTENSTSQIPSESQGSEKKFTRPRQIQSPIRPQRYSPPNTFSSSGSSPTPCPIIVDKSKNQLLTGKIAWTEIKSPPPPPKSPSYTQQKAEFSTPPRYNTFSPSISSAERAKSLRKNAPFPLSSPPTPLRVAAIKAQQDAKKSTKDENEPWASPSQRQYRIPSKGSPQIGRNQGLSKDFESVTPLDHKFKEEDFVKNKSFQYREGAYGCGGNVFEI